MVDNYIFLFILVVISSVEIHEGNIVGWDYIYLKLII